MSKSGKSNITTVCTGGNKDELTLAIFKELILANMGAQSEEEVQKNVIAANKKYEDAGILPKTNK